MSTHHDDRPSVHNAAVDETMAQHGACGQTHLPTGRTCVLPQAHAGSCEFVPRDRAVVMLEERSATQS